MTLGERIKFVRKTNKLNQSQFAKMLGISQTHVSKIENGTENPSETLLLFISYKFAVNIEWLKFEKGTYDGEFGASSESYFDKLIFVRHKIEEKATYMNTDSIWEYVDSIINFEALLDCCETNRLNDKEVRKYYKIIKQILFRLLQLTTWNYMVNVPVEKVKENLYDDINKLIEAYNEL